MNKTLTFKVNGEEYKLTFNRETVIATENMGFNVTEFAEKPVGSLTLLWRGAFLANHGMLTFEEIDAIFDKVDHNGILDALLELYRAPIESLFDEDNAKNSVKWTVN